MYPNLLKQRLRDGEIILGSALPAPSPHAAGTVLDTNPDFLWADTEHMPYGTEALDSILVLSRMRGVAPMVRLAMRPASCPMARPCPDRSARA